MRAAAPGVVPVSTNEGGGVGRLFVFIVDQNTLEPGSARHVATAASRFFTELTFADRSALMLMPVGPNVAFTWAHDRVREGLQRVTGTGQPMTDWEYGSLSEARDIANRNLIALRSVGRARMRQLDLRRRIRRRRRWGWRSRSATRRPRGGGGGRWSGAAAASAAVAPEVERGGTRRRRREAAAGGRRRRRSARAGAGERIGASTPACARSDAGRGGVARRADDLALEPHRAASGLAAARDASAATRRSS